MLFKQVITRPRLAQLNLWSSAPTVAKDGGGHLLQIRQSPNKNKILLELPPIHVSRVTRKTESDVEKIGLMIEMEEFEGSGAKGFLDEFYNKVSVELEKRLNITRMNHLLCEDTPIKDQMKPFSYAAEDALQDMVYCKVNTECTFSVMDGPQQVLVDKAVSVLKDGPLGASFIITLAPMWAYISSGVGASNSFPVTLNLQVVQLLHLPPTLSANESVNWPQVQWSSESHELIAKSGGANAMSKLADIQACTAWCNQVASGNRAPTKVRMGGEKPRIMHTPRKVVEISSKRMPEVIVDIDDGDDEEDEEDADFSHGEEEEEVELVDKKSARKRQNETLEREAVEYTKIGKQTKGSILMEAATNVLAPKIRELAKSLQPMQLHLELMQRIQALEMRDRDFMQAILQLDTKCQTEGLTPKTVKRLLTSHLNTIIQKVLKRIQE